MSRPRLVDPREGSGVTLAPDLLVQMHDLMVKARVLEERLIQMYKQGDGYFWIGGPGEEAFNVPLGMLMRKGQGPEFDYGHFHYRQLATLLAMGEDPLGALRQMKNTATDPYSAGRNFAGHMTKRVWNIAPITSPIEVQYSIAPGTALAQKRLGGDGITIVTGGDAGTAEGDFATCLVWSTRPGNELPMLIIVTNNQWGISTAAGGQHGETRIADRGKAFNMRTKTIEGNDPEVAYLEIKEAMEYVRKERKPFLLEAMVSRLYGHSSASGANFVGGEPDCIALFEQRLENARVLTRAQMDEVRTRWTAEIAALAKQARSEPQPAPESIWDHVFGEELTVASMAQAIRMALHYAEENLGVTDVFGQDVGPPLGGVFTCTQGLRTAWNSPLDERGIIGTAMGLAMAGQKPVAEIQFVDYIFNTMDLLKIAGNTRWGTAGDWNLPLVLRTPVGSGIRGSIYHSHSFDATATHIPGWKIVMPSNPLDAYGLLLSACKEEDPVMYLEPKALLRIRGDELIPGEPGDDRALSKMIDAPLGDRSRWKPEWPKLEGYTVPIGKAKIVRAGSQLTVVSYGRTLPLCLRAANELASEGIDAEVIDLRTLAPYDWDAIRDSIRKTGRVLFVNEDTEITNFGEHLLRRTIDELFWELLARPRLLAGKFLPGVGLADVLEMASVPQQNDIASAIREVAAESP